MSSVGFPGRRPRVALLHYTALPVIGGVEIVIANQLGLLVAAGYSTTLIVGRGGATDLPPEVEVKVIPEIDSEHPANLALLVALERGELPLAFEILCARIDTALTEAFDTVDIVLAHNVLTQHFNMPLLVALHRQMSRRTTPRFVAWCHDLSRYINPFSGVPSRYGFPWDLIRTYQVELVYVAVSVQRRQQLAHSLGCPDEKIQVIPNGVDAVNLLGLSQLGQRLINVHHLLEVDLIILMPIRITRAKNIEFALRVVAALKRDGLRLKLIVTGPLDPHEATIGTYFNQLRALRKELGIEREAIFICEGRSELSQPQILVSSEVAELYRLCDLVLMPSHREGFGLPILESGLIGKPVFVTAAVPIVNEIGENLVHCIAQDESPQAVAQRILHLASADPTFNLRQHIRQAYTWPAIFTKSIEPLITSLVGAANNA